MRIALLEDDGDQASWIADLLRSAGHQVDAVDRGRTLLRRVSTESYDLLVLDWELPDISGLEVLRAIREQLVTNTPVLFLTHRDRESDIVDALEAGADDYLVKPPRNRELISRVTALARRSGSGAKVEVLDVGQFRIDVERRILERDGRTVELTKREFDVAVMLFRNLGKVVSRSHMLMTVWGNTDGSTTRTVDTHVSRVRIALGLSTASGVRLTPVYGYGYRLECVPREPA